MVQIAKLCVFGMLFFVVIGVMFGSKPSLAKQVNYKKEFSESVIAEDVERLGIDQNGDGMLSRSEIDAVTSFIVGGEGVYEASDNVIVSLKDLKLFKNLQKIKINVRVDNLKPLYGMKKLKSLEIGERVTYEESIKPEKFPHLRRLSIYQNFIPVLNVSKNSRLQVLKCPGNRIKQLIISQNRKLIKLDCADNRITKLNMKKNGSLKEIHCENNKLKKLDLSKNHKIKFVTCWGNKLKSINFSKHAKVKKLNCSFNKIKVLQNLSVEELVEFQFESNNLSVLNLRNAKRLKFIYAEGNVLKRIDMRGGISLERFVLKNKKNVKCLVILPAGFTNYSIYGAYEITK